MDKHLVASVDEFKNTFKKIVKIKGLEIGVFCINGKYYAWRNVCPHNAAPVCQGSVSGTTLDSKVYEYEYGREKQILRCPWHGWEFDLINGQHLADPTVKLKGYRVIEEDKKIYVSLKGGERE